VPTRECKPFTPPSPRRRRYGIWTPHTPTDDLLVRHMLSPSSTEATSPDNVGFTVPYSHLPQLSQSSFRVNLPLSVRKTTATGGFAESAHPKGILPGEKAPSPGLPYTSPPPFQIIVNDDLPNWPRPSCRRRRFYTNLFPLPYKKGMGADSQPVAHPGQIKAQWRSPLLQLFAIPSFPLLSPTKPTFRPTLMLPRFSSKLQPFEFQTTSCQLAPHPTPSSCPDLCLTPSFLSFPDGGPRTIWPFYLRRVVPFLPS